jgi:hypothetical protein
MMSTGYGRSFVCAGRDIFMIGSFLRVIPHDWIRYAREDSIYLFLKIFSAVA